ncbi:peroxin-16 [Sporothrix schenckii 1099-18]|uniref:Peroxisomal membrane protein PEX16 n=1 Tax=Sporothrix schenckii 1099-18 TaxID=1397361 RepID=A0A0F2M543_SPOSC|nr:peroxin-16 [Sporothrix schenckii 1099-18]KJR83306.1 peroxin-16 [Sporothrix schenckii 1099-18]
MVSSQTSPAGPATSTGTRLSPAKWLAAYDNFIAKNLGQVSQIESTLRSLTYIIPGRFRDAEIASEAIHSGVQLLSLYHDLLLLRTPSTSTPPTPSGHASTNAPKLPPGPAQPPSHHTRYTRFWIQKSPFYRRVAIVLQVVRYTELLCEMAAKRRGERLRWRVVILIEAIKAVCQLLLFRITRGRMLLTPALPVRQPLPENEEDVDDHDEDGLPQESKAAADSTANEDGQPTGTAPSQKAVLSPQPPLSPPPSPRQASADPDVEAASQPSGRAPLSPSPTETQALPPSHTKGWTMPRTQMSMPPLPQPGDISSYLLSRVLTADDIKPATKLLNQLRGSAQVAEIIHILTPLVYAVALARTHRKGRTSWAPWLAGLAMECAARQLRDHSLRTPSLEREEWGRRGWAMGWWTMRGAFYEHVMKGVVGGVRSRVPGFIGGIIEDYEYLWENYYFSTSPQ